MLVVEVVLGDKVLGGKVLGWSEEVGTTIGWDVVDFMSVEDTLVAADNNGGEVEVELGTGADSSSASTQ